MFEGVGKVSGCQIRVMIRLKTLIDAAFSYYIQSILSTKYTTNIRAVYHPQTRERILQSDRGLVNSEGGVEWESMWGIFHFNNILKSDPL